MKTLACVPCKGFAAGKGRLRARYSGREVGELGSAMLADVVWCASAYEAVEGADALALLTEWNEFRALDLDRVKSLAKTAVMVDLRNIYRPDDMRERGFSYTSIGRD